MALGDHCQRCIHHQRPQNVFEEDETEEAAESEGRVHPSLEQCARPHRSHRQGLPVHQGEDQDNGPPPPSVRNWPPS